MDPVPFHLDRTDRSAWPSAPARAAILAYGALSYAVGVAALLDVIFHCLGLRQFTGGPLRVEGRLAAALVDVALLVAFAAQHSVMARPWWKERWTRLVPPSLERSTYVLATGLVLLPLLWLWQPLPVEVWSLEAPGARRAVTALAVAGWAYLFAASFAIDHFELFGLQQAWRGHRGQEPVAPPFRERWMYRFDRHPIMTGLLVGLWATPRMDLGHLLFSAGLTVYVIVGVHLEERALLRHWGATYADYRRRVPTIVPLWPRSQATAPRATDG